MSALARAAILVLLGGLVAGCSRHVALRTPRGDEATLVEDGDGQHLVVDRGAHDEYLAVSPESVTFDARGEVAYAALTTAGWALVVGDRVAASGFDAVRSIAWAPQRGVVHAVVATPGGDRVVLVHEGDPHRVLLGPALGHVARGSMVADAEGHLAYVALAGERSIVIADGAASRPWRGVAGLGLDREGRPVYAARDGEAAWVVRGGAELGPFVDVADVVRDPARLRAVALVRDAEGWRALAETASAPWDAIGDLRVTARSVAFRGRRGDGESVVVDGRTFGPYPEVVPHSLRLVGSVAAWAVRQRSREQVFLEGRPQGLPHDEVLEIAVGARGEVAWIGRDGERHVVVDQGGERGPFAAARDLRLGRDGRLLALVLADEGPSVIDGPTPSPIPTPGALGGTLRFASDGRTWGVLALERRGFALRTAQGRAAHLGVGEVFDEALRRRDPRSVASSVDAWTTAELEALVDDGG